MAGERFCGCGRKLGWMRPSRTLGSNTARNVNEHADKLAEWAVAMPHFAALVPVEAQGRELGLRPAEAEPSSDSSSLLRACSTSIW